ncbi:hypothetical protein T11_10885 [Trichinella zimbabwensis]|uniref:Uncharacterized protein n=1 Tax=Trichinella zimbabwensis TaxID=268475 RepID=A0A0V1G906_9BILA|nr:hypothetical protein T11_10885 [Trichinella zimbabwensis]
MKETFVSHCERLEMISQHQVKKLLSASSSSSSSSSSCMHACMHNTELMPFLTGHYYFLAE